MKNYVWACDFSKNTGEGKLARLFVKKKIKNPFIIKFNSNSKIFKYKYCIPFVGIVFCWYYYLKSKKIFFINYLPLWNPLIFLLLPPNTSIGPITGGANFSKNAIRKYLFPILYFISQIILYFRFNKLIFSTSLLEKNLLSIIKKKSEFNFILFFLKKKVTKKKSIDFLIYYREHKNKKKFFPFKFVKKLVNEKYKVFVFGDKLKIQGLKNLGLINNSKVNLYLKKSRFSIASGENLLSLFTIECINHNVKILIEEKLNEKIPQKLKLNFIKSSFQEKNIKRKLKKFYSKL